MLSLARSGEDWNPYTDSREFFRPKLQGTAPVDRVTRNRERDVNEMALVKRPEAGITMGKKPEISCDEVRSLMGVYLDFDANLEAISLHFKNCEACQGVWRDNHRISRMVKHAVEIESVPQSSVERIRKRLEK